MNSSYMYYYDYLVKDYGKVLNANTKCIAMVRLTVFAKVLVCALEVVDVRRSP